LPSGARERIARRAAEDAHRLTARYTRTKRRIDESTTGHHFQRIREADLMREAMVLAALAFMCVIPLLITLAALSPLGNETSLGTQFGKRLGLSQAASKDVSQLFASPNTVRGASTAVGVIIGIAFAYGWPATLQRGFEIAWRLPPLGVRGMWRPAVWVLGFIAAVGSVGAIGSTIHGAAGHVLIGLYSTALTFFGAWASQFLLLGGRIAWRPLLPGAIATTIGLVGLRGFSALFFSAAIVSNAHSYGPIGTVFILLSWVIGFSFVVLGGAIVGNSIYEHSKRRSKVKRSLKDLQRSSTRAVHP
jgi:membrane protein